MPRRPRRATGQYVFHVFNRAIQTLTLFERPRDYEAFLRVVQEATEQCPMRIIVYSLMPTHFHLALWPLDDTGLSRFMQWLTATHARRWRESTRSSGRGALYQGRFKAIPVQRDYHLIRMCRYVERNALRAKLVRRAEDWPWSTASPEAAAEHRPQLTAWPVPKPADWLEVLNVPEPEKDLHEIRQAIRNNVPFGQKAWRNRAIKELEWPCLRGRGRPRKCSPVAMPVRSPNPPFWPLCPERSGRPARRIRPSLDSGARRGEAVDVEGASPGENGVCDEPADR
jgi:putative transposase